MTQDRPDRRERLLRAAVRHLEKHGEAELRIVEIADEADVALGLIRHHFGSRDGLVAAAQERRLEGATRSDIRAIRRLLDGVETSEELLAGLEQLTRALLEHRRRDVRLSRLAAIAAAHGRPDLRAEVGATLAGLRGALEEVIAGAQERGIVRADVDAGAVATFIQAYALGLIVHDLDPDGVEHDVLVATIRVAVEALLTDHA